MDKKRLNSPFKIKYPPLVLHKSLDNCLLSNNIMDYHVVSQGKTTIPNVDDGEELELTDVRYREPIFKIIRCSVPLIRDH